MKKSHKIMRSSHFGHILGVRGISAPFGEGGPYGQCLCRIFGDPAEFRIELRPPRSGSSQLRIACRAFGGCGRPRRRFPRGPAPIRHIPDCTSGQCPFAPYAKGRTQQARSGSMIYHRVRVAFHCSGATRPPPRNPRLGHVASMPQQKLTCHG